MKQIDMIGCNAEKNTNLGQQMTWKNKKDAIEGQNQN
jgi:hypothetical protein